MKVLELSIFVVVLFLGLACTEAEGNKNIQPIPEGQRLFEQYCISCHGKAGNAGLNGAENLIESTISEGEIISVITYGRGGMMPYNKILKAEQIEEVKNYVISLRK